MGIVQAYLQRLLVWYWMASFAAGVSGGDSPAHKGPAGADERSFSDKALVVWVKSYNCACVDHARLKSLGNRTFLVGQVIAMPGHSFGAGRTVWIAVDEVAEVYEYDNAAQLQEAYQQAFTSAPPPTLDGDRNYNAPPGVQAAAHKDEEASRVPPVPADSGCDRYYPCISAALQTPPAGSGSPEPTKPTIQEPIELQPGVTEMRTNRFDIPVAVNSERIDEIDLVTVYFSRDHGKTWLPHITVPPWAQSVPFGTEHDGEYRFAVRIIYKDGRMEPRKDRDLVAMQTVYVNGQKRPVKQASQ